MSYTNELFELVLVSGDTKTNGSFLKSPLRSHPNAIIQNGIVIS